MTEKKYGKEQMPLEELEDRIDKWHSDHKTPLSIWEYIGLTKDEYVEYVTGQPPRKERIS